MNIPYILKMIVVGMLETNCYLVADAKTRECAVIDPGDEGERIMALITKEDLKPVMIINTHSHADHIGADTVIHEAYRIPIFAHTDDAADISDPEGNLSAKIGMPFSAPAVERKLKDGDIITLGQLTLTVIHTPGHTRGGMSLAVEDLLFTGDTLFYGTVGRTDLPGGSDTVLLHSLKKFDILPKTMRVLPGHGQASTLAYEYKHNIFLGRP